ncbi:MAG: HNH endonuclease, partial [Bacilli bacterium]
MRITKDLIAKNHTFSKCVICKCVFGDDDKNPQSDEHLIPEFLGGNFKIGLLCKMCNNAMGGGFEDRLAQSFLGRAHANKYQIKGKSLKIPNSPLVGDYYHDNKKIFLTPDYKIKTHYSVECIQNDEKGIVFSGHIDASDLESSKKRVLTTVMRAFKKQGKKADEEIIYKQISTIIDNSVINVEQSPTIYGKITIDLNDIELLLLKIAYEALCIHFGELITNDEFFDPWRISLKEQKIEASIEYENDNFFTKFKSIIDTLPVHNLINFKEFEQDDARDNILIILLNEVVFVRCIGIWIKFRTNQKLPTCLYEHSVLDSQLRFY